MAFSTSFGAVAFVVLILPGTRGLAVTILHETDANGPVAVANFIGSHNGSIRVFGFQNSDFDWFSFHGTASDNFTLEIQD